MNKIIQIIADELNVKEEQVTNTIKLIDDGNTIPFIARYRKEVTGGLSDEILRDLDERLKYLRNLEERKQEVIKSIDGQGKLTDEIVQSLENAKTLSEVEDIYRPYKQKKKTRATIAKAKGLEPLAQIIFEQNDKRNIEEIAKEFIDEEKGVLNVEEAIQGAKDIIAENISDNPNYRKQIKRMCYREGIIMVKGTKEEKSAYDMYYNFNEKVNRIPSHRILAINRGEKEEFLKIKLEKPEEKILKYIEKDITYNVKLPREDKSLVVPLSSEEIIRIDDILLDSYVFENCNLYLRNTLIIHLMLDAGLRKTEVINLNVNDIDLKKKVIYINNTKYNKSRVIPLSSVILNLYNSYLNDREYNEIGLFNNSPLLIKAYGKRITSDTIKSIFRRLKKQSGIERIHPHLLRHTFATSYLMQGGNLEQLRIILGHSDYNVTRHYLHLAASNKLLNYDYYKLDENIIH